MARLKSLLRSVVEDRSPRFLLGTIALGVVISLLAGFAIGYKYEKSRRAPVKKGGGTTQTTKPPKNQPAAIKQAPLLIGAVLNVKPKALVIIGPDKKAISITVGARTRFAVAKAGKLSNIVAGSRVVFQASANSTTTATEIVVLPKTALLGTPVTAVKPGTSMSLKSLKGPDLVIKTTGAKVDVTGPGTRRSAAKNSRVLVQYFKVGKKGNSAVQVVVVPKSSAFR
jgi:hypothetical protein